MHKIIQNKSVVLGNFNDDLKNTNIHIENNNFENIFEILTNSIKDLRTMKKYINYIFSNYGKFHQVYDKLEYIDTYYYNL